MTVRAGLRHVLVVASQCAAMPPIPDLDRVAARLHAVLRDERIGGCEPGLPDGESLKVGAGARQIEEHLRAATEYAERKGATLVLALLGHGFIPGEDPCLYFMGSDSRPGERSSGVPVDRFVVEATDGRVNGVVAVIDSCHAGAALARSLSLTGNRAGRTRLALLYAAGAQQEAYDLVLSRTLIALLSSGVDDNQPCVDVGMAAATVNRVAGRQSVGSMTFDGDPTLVSAQWLGLNRRFSRPSGLLGPRGRRMLLDAVAFTDDAAVGRHRSAGTPRDLEDLHAALLALPETPQRNHALMVVSDLRIAALTTAFIRGTLRQGLTRRRLNGALRFALPHRQPDDLITEADFVEEVATAYPAVPSTPNCVPAMAGFVVALADAAGLDQDDPELCRWADAVLAAVPVSDAWERLRNRSSTRQLRLVIRLDEQAATQTWPDEVEAWVLGDGDTPHHGIFPCRPSATRLPDRADVEAALSRAVDWAEDLVEEMHSEGLTAELGRMDVAMSAALLLSWRPEEVLHTIRLGVTYDVVRHWGLRSDARLRRHALRRMRAIEESANGLPLHWLDAVDTGDIGNLRNRLELGELRFAIGVAHDLGDNDRLAELLLTFTPILMWAAGTDAFHEAHREYTTSNWHRLPGGFLDSYRARWGGAAADCLADLQFVWDDTDWLEFCREHAGWPPSQGVSK